jgi:hypothetical protein
MTGDGQNRVRDAAFDEDHLRIVRGTENEAHDGEFRAVLKRKAEHGDVVVTQELHEGHERTDAVLQEDGELAHRRTLGGIRGGAGLGLGSGSHGRAFYFNNQKSLFFNRQSKRQRTR